MSSIFVIWLVGVTVSDLARRQVSNRWVLAGAVAALVALASGHSPFGVDAAGALASGAGAFAVLLCFYAAGLMGAGDVKFAGVLGLWMGGPPLLPIAVGAGLLAGLHGICCLARHGGSSVLRWRTAPGATAATPSTAGCQIPYAAYLAIAALLWTALRLGTTLD